MRALIVLSGLGLLLQVGCGSNCQSTCGRIYGEGVDNGASQCGIRAPGQTQAELTADCIDECETALAKSGEMGEYDPETRLTTGESIELENERQVAAWMDCVNAVSCEDLDDGYCAPI